MLFEPFEFKLQRTFLNFLTPITIVPALRACKVKPVKIRLSLRVSLFGIKKLSALILSDKAFIIFNWPIGLGTVVSIKLVYFSSFSLIILIIRQRSYLFHNIAWLHYYHNQ